MKITTITKTTKDVEELFKLIMKLYWTYLDALECYIRQIPDTETAVLNDLIEHMEEVQGALEHDISIFQKAINNDTEDLHKIHDQLKIDTIYKKLKK
jgi:hypothetical protein